jgi:putative membrane protein
MTYPAPNPILYKKLTVISYILSAAVFILVGLMRQIKIDLGIDFSFLPPYHAIFNTIVAIFLILAIIFIKKGDYITHKWMIMGAITFSALFLVCYVLYHFTTQETIYCGEFKGLYYSLLISHIILAGVSLPFIMITFSRGITMQVQIHKKMARWVFPVWLYVAVSGPLCYLMLKPCYI